MKKLLFKIARSSVASYFIGFAFEYLTPLMPLKFLASNRFAVAFQHPSPYWPTHYLIVPKKRLPTFAALDLADPIIATYATEIFAMAQEIAAEQNMRDYSVLVNGGHYQDVPQMHFHLFYGAVDGVPWGQEIFAYCGGDSAEIHHKQTVGYPHPEGVREFHYVLIDTGGDSAEMLPSPHNLVDLLTLAQKIVVQEALEQYSLLANWRDGSDEPFCFHLVSGSALT